MMRDGVNGSVSLPKSGTEYRPGRTLHMHTTYQVLSLASSLKVIMLMTMKDYVRDKLSSKLLLEKYGLLLTLLHHAA